MAIAESNPKVADNTDVATLIRRLRVDGYAMARGFIHPHTRQLLAAEGDALIGRFTRDGYRSEDYWCYDVANQTLPMLYRVHNLEKQGAQRIAELFADGPLHQLASAVLRSPVVASVCAMIVKTPGVAAVPWHRDRTNVPPTNAVNLSVFLDEASPENGCIEVVPGSHLQPDDADVDQARSTGPHAQVLAAPEDVLIHDVRLVHGSGDNTSQSIRRSIVIEFSSVGPTHGE